MSLASDLLPVLHGISAGRVRLRVEELWEAFRRARPDEALASGARAGLAAALESLQEQGELTQPRGAKGWDRTARPPLPQWVKLVRPPRPPADGPDPAAIPWAPELAFVPGLKRVSHMPELQAIQAFLVAGGRERPMVPKRERSLELFGDEKRLDALVKRSLFVRGHLSLDLLRCFEVPPPLVWEAGPPKSRGRAILTVENHHTWHSFCRWNRTAGAYAAVVYGGGDRFVGAAADLERVSEATNANGRVDYFGDLDGRGLKIPVAACKMTHLPILPAARWYDILLDPVKVPPDRGDVHVPPGLVAWLAREHREPTARLLSHGMRLPQEWVGWEVLGGSLP